MALALFSLKINVKKPAHARVWIFGVGTAYPKICWTK
jgi:hypothetical protein